MIGVVREMVKAFWFSENQGELLDTLGVPKHFVFIDGEWVRYTLSTDSTSYPGTWPDFVLLASGEGIPTKSVAAEEPVSI